MPDTKTENLKANGKIRVLKLKRETLRELDAGELKQAQGGPGSTSGDFTCRRCTSSCATAKHCTHPCR